MNEFNAFLNVRRNKWQFFLKFRISLTRRTDYVIEQLLRRLRIIPVESDRAESHQHAFVDLEPQTIPTLDLIFHRRLGVTVLAVINLDEEGEIVRARWR